MKKVTKVILILIFEAASIVHAGERFEFYNGVRALSMGGAAVASVNDETALLYNPAALGKLRDYFVTVADPEAEIGVDTLDIIDSGYTKFLDPQETLDACKLAPGDRLHQRAQIFPSFVVTNFGFGFYGRVAADAEVNETSTIFDYNFRNDYAFVMGFNFRLFDGMIKLGANARLINRVESHREDIPLNQVNMDFETVINNSSVASEGTGVGTDAGIIITAPWMFLPSIAAVYRDIGTTSYNLNTGVFYDTTQRPDRTPSTLDAGFSITPILGKGVRMTITAEMVDVMDVVEPEDEEAQDEVMRRIHGGVEFNIGDIVFIRGGMNQGYWTAGLEIAVENTQFQIGSYGEEVADVVPFGSTAEYEALEDRRYVAKFAYRF